MPERDITNSKLGRFLTVEILISVGVGLATAVAAWTLITQQVSATESEVNNVKTRQEKIADDVVNIKTDVGIIKADQKNIKEDVQETKEDIRAIRELIQRQYSRSDD
jgi:peptidoglycan hydrolase CwlO-like protein